MMKRYDFYGPESGPGIEEREDGEWVPAEVAQALYEVVMYCVDNPEFDSEMLDIIARKALSLADGEME